MKRAVIIGSSGGIGAALAAQFTSNGVDVTGLSRRGDGFDITNEESVHKHMTAIQNPIDLLLVTTGILSAGPGPEKTIRALDPDEMARVFAVNAIGPALVLKHAKHLLDRRSPATVAVLSARVGSIGDNRLGGWYSYRASKAAVNQIVRTAAVEYARTHPFLTCVALHPGTVSTAFTKEYSNHSAVRPDAAASNILGVLEGLSPLDTGGFFDWSGKPVPW